MRHVDSGWVEEVFLVNVSRMGGLWSATGRRLWNHEMTRTNSSTEKSLIRLYYLRLTAYPWRYLFLVSVWFCSLSCFIRCKSLPPISLLMFAVSVSTRPDSEDKVTRQLCVPHGCFSTSIYKWGCYFENFFNSRFVEVFTLWPSWTGCTPLWILIILCAFQ